MGSWGKMARTVVHGMVQWWSEGGWERVMGGNRRLPQ